MRQFVRCVIVLFACLASTKVFSEEDCSWDGCNWQGNWEQGAIFGGGAVAFFDTDLRLGFSALVQQPVSNANKVVRIDFREQGERAQA